ncbi:complement C5 [Rhinatrema bivittatum]|uniref:complement C5 n=1 Tax=Rhinatrema bivittatum TaxID=194408 RepID=UPI001128D47A|nr:complement C5 [Rhinatrema bivittatum]
MPLSEPLAASRFCLLMDILKLACILGVCGTIRSQEQTYLITAPKIFRIGASESIVVQAFGYQNPFSISISIKSYPDKKTTYATDHLQLSDSNRFQGILSLTIQPKDLPRTDTSQPYVYLQALAKGILKEEKVPVTYKNGFLFVQTDKPIYTPIQSVNVRVYSLNEELKPALRSIILTFVDPEGVKVDIIEAEDFTGIVAFPEFKIPVNPKYGEWKIEAAYKKDFTTSGMARFEVKEYAMPTFSISIEPEKSSISYETFESFTITIRSSYFYNKKISSAEVYVRYGIIENGIKRMIPRTIQTADMSNGVAVVTFNSKKAVKEIGYAQLEDLDGCYLYITASVLESSGGHSEESEFADVKYVLSPYTLKLMATPLFVRPGLPFHIKVQVQDTSEKPVGRIPVTLISTSFTADYEETLLVDESQDAGNTITSVDDGMALFILNIPANTNTLTFKIKTADSHLPEESQVSAEYTAKTYASLSKSYLYIDWAVKYKLLHVGEYLNINVYPRSPNLHKIKHYSYLVLSKGKIVKHGTVDRYEDSVFQSLNIETTKEMVPSARLLVYYIVTSEQTAELVADSIWMNIEEKCVNSLKVTLTTNANSYKPGECMNLNIKAQKNSYIALSSMDTAIYGIARRKKRPMERVLMDFEKSDLGCGAGGGSNNADVFAMAGLTFITNANVEASKDPERACTEVLRPKRSFEDEINKIANTYTNKNVRKCCLDGVREYPVSETCESRLQRIGKWKGKFCMAAFKRCCERANELRAVESGKHLILARMELRTILEVDEPEVRSYFPESWMWEVHEITVSSGLKALSFTLPDSLTTWEIEGIGLSAEGLCVANPVKVQVFKDVFLDMHIPYSVVRGEQIELRGSLYNYRDVKIKFCVTLSVGEGICLFKGSATKLKGIQSSSCTPKFIEGSSDCLVMFTILPLELGLHTVNFTLKSEYGSEILIKTLQVVPEGIKREHHVGFTLDPQGVYGSIRRRQEFRYRVPSGMVPKSKIDRTVSIKGHLIGEVISAVLSAEGINTLTSLPKLSAETELMRIAPAFYVFHYLEKLDSWHLLGPQTFTSRVNMRRKMKEGIISILAFRNNDFSYSMWNDDSPSTWLTAFALRIFGQVHQYVALNEMSVCNSLLWLIDGCQMKDGSFMEHSNYKPVKLQGTLPTKDKEKALYLTAFVLIGFQKAYHMCPTLQIKDAMNRAEEYVASSVDRAQSTFTLAIAAYALALSDPSRPATRSAFMALKKEALVKDTGNPPIYRFWKDTFNNVDASTPNAGTAQIVETTAYALLTILLHGDQSYANPVVRWLSEEQRYGGGYYSTQDTVNALEALTQYAVLNKKLELNMIVRVSYKKGGDFQHYELTEKNHLARPAEAPLADDLVVSTVSGSGLATAHVRSVYHIMSTSEEICSFTLKIDLKANKDGRSKRNSPQQSLFPQTRILEACAKYKPNEREPYLESSHAVMKISLVSGLVADERDLHLLANGVDHLISDYNVNDGQVVLQLDSIPSNDFLCVAFRVKEIFHVGMLNPSPFTVYEFHAPDKQCTIFYNPYGDEHLVKLCQGDECKCMEAECSQMQNAMDLSITADKRRDKACLSDTVYAYKVMIVSSTEDGNFMKYAATLQDIYKKGESFVKRNTEVAFIKKKTCSDVELNGGNQYLIMGKEGLQIQSFFSFRYEYPLDSMTWIEWWPTEADCDAAMCKTFVNTLDEFSENILLFGC